MDNELSQQSTVNFDNGLGELTADMLEDWLFVLGQANKENMKAASNGCSGHLKDDCYFGYIVSICDELSQPPEVRYVAIEIFDAFMKQHVADMQCHVMEITDNDVGFLAEWNRVMKRLGNQIVLRIHTCVQIASKLHLIRGAPTMGDIENSLASTEKSYKPHTILKSELRVLDTLKYRLNICHPLLFIEALLGVLELNRAGIVATGRIYQVALSVLDVFYLKRRHIFNAVFRRLTGESKMESDDQQQQQQQLDEVAHDSLAVACAVLAAAIYFIDAARFEFIVEHLHDVTHVAIDDVLDLALVLINTIRHDGDADAEMPTDSETTEQSKTQDG